MKQLLSSPKAEIIAEVWDELEPVLLAQQRALSCREGSECTPDELKGFTIAYNVIETFALEGRKRIAERKKNQTT